jgi:hypothetical protein
MNDLEEAHKLYKKQSLQLSVMQQDLINKGHAFARITDKGIELIPCHTVYLDWRHEPNTGY